MTDDEIFAIILERDALKKAIDSFGNNPAGFDWAVLAKIDEQEKEIADLKTKLQAATAKWTVYEQEYILPCFDIADEMDYDLKQAVKDNPGKNCVMLLFEELLR